MAIMRLGLIVLEMEWSSECLDAEKFTCTRDDVCTFDRDPRIIDKGKINRKLRKRIPHFDQIFSFFMLFLDACMD